MSYTLFTDKSTEFKCRIQLEGASLKDARARLVVNSGTKSVLYEGKIERDGHCYINIDGIKDFFVVDDRGNMQLEIIADGNYFQPWSSDFAVTASKRLQVEVFSADVPKRPTMKVQIESPEQRLTESIVAELRSAGINRTNIKSRTKLVSNIIKDRVDDSGISNPKQILSTVIERITHA